VKLLLDQNISFRLIKIIASHFDDVQQVRLLGLENTSDIEIWRYAKKNNFAIVTFDVDFSDFASLFGHPPKIIWLRGGNKTTQAIAGLLIQNAEIIDDFLNSEKYTEIACLEID